jgi:hypothetical protein
MTIFVRMAINDYPLKVTYVIRNQVWLIYWDIGQFTKSDFAEGIEGLAKQVSAIQTVRFTRRADGMAANHPMPGIPMKSEFTGGELRSTWVSRVVVASICMTVKAESNSVLRVTCAAL